MTDKQPEVNPVEEPKKAPEPKIKPIPGKGVKIGDRGLYKLPSGLIVETN